MRILYYSSEDMLKEGAGSTHFFEVARNLISLNNELLILLPGYNFRRKKNEIYGLNIVFVPTGKKNIISYLLYEFMNMFYSIFYIFRFKPDVIYIRQGLFELFLPILSKLFCIPYVVEKNGIVEDELKARGFNIIIIKILKLVENFNLILSNKIICVTEGIKREIIRRYKISKNKIVVIPNGANTDLFRPLDKHYCKKKLNLSEDFFYVGFVGSFAPWQGLETLIEAAKLIKERNYGQIKFILVGDGKLEYHLRQKVLEYKLEDSVKFTGRIPYKDVVYYINAFDIAVSPFSEIRNKLIGLSPLKIYEYLSCGCPVIASKIGGIGEIIVEGQCGYLFSPENFEELAERIIESYNIRHILPEVGIKGRSLVMNKYSWKIVANKIFRVFKEFKSYA